MVNVAVLLIFIVNFKICTCFSSCVRWSPWPSTVTSRSPTQHKRSRLHMQHAYNSREEQRSAVASILTVYFVQGAVGLSSLAISYFLKDDLRLPPAEGGFLLGISSIPWVIKPLYGLLSDGVPLFGYRRKSYLLLASSIGAVAWLLLGTVAQGVPAVLACVFVSSLSIAVCDVVADSLAAELSRTANKQTSERKNDQRSSASGNIQSLCKGMYALGGSLSAYFSGSLLETLTSRQIFQLTAALPLLTGIAALFLQEHRQSNTRSPAALVGSMKGQLLELLNTLRIPSILMPVAFNFLWQATPSSGSTLFYYYTNALNFSPEFLGEVRLASSLAALAGVLAFRWKLKDVPLRSMLKWSIVLSVPLSLSQVLLTTHLNRHLGLPDQAFTLSDSVILSALGEISFLPVLVLASSLCPPGGEGALFATLMSIFNAGGILGGEIGATLTGLLGITTTNFDNITLLVVLCSVSNLLPLLVIDRLLPQSNTRKAPE